jgi:ABC-type uncharacterized transport system involved in gliding motility auxiliary subunit
VELQVVKGLVESATAVPAGIEVEDLTNFLNACQGGPFSMELLQTCESLTLGREPRVRHDNMAAGASNPTPAAPELKTDTQINQWDKTMFAV